MVRLHRRSILAALVLAVFTSVCGPACAADPLKILFLGDRGTGHRPGEKAKAITPIFEKKGILVDYTEDMKDLNLDKLQSYKVLLVFANIVQIAPEQEAAVLKYVEEGGGFAPIHCASFCFQNSEKMIALTGGQFSTHARITEFGVVSAEVDHPIMKGYKSFRAADEAYVHRKHNPENRIVLEYRKELAQGSGVEQEPWTWVRTQGKGRVFYTAWGHDMRTWNQPGFQELLERGVRWAAGSDEVLPPRVEAPAAVAPAPATPPANPPAAPPAGQ